MPVPIQWECDECMKQYPSFDETAVCEYAHYSERIAKELADWEAAHPDEEID